MAYFAKFTERGQRALLTAQREAAQLGRTYVGTEHLLLGVLSDPGAASVVLKGITLDAARQEIIQILGRGDDDSPVRTMVYTPRTKKAVSYTHLVVVGMFAPSPTAMTPFLISVLACSACSSFCVAQGRATSQGTSQMEPSS